MVRWRDRDKPCAPLDRSRWEKFKSRPLIFVLIVILVPTVLAIAQLISAGADYGPFKEQLYEWGWIQPFPSREDDEILIVIATYGTFEDRPSAIQNEIKTVIEQQVLELNLTNIRVEIERSIIQSNERQKAEELGTAYDATMIIWGTDSPFRVETNFLDFANQYPESNPATYIPVNPSDPALWEFDPGLFKNASILPDEPYTYVAERINYVQFVTRDLTPQITFLALYAIGSANVQPGNEVVGESIIRYAVDKFSSSMDSQFQSKLSSVWLRLGYRNQESGFLWKKLFLIIRKL